MLFISFVLFSCIVVSLIWARLRFFKMTAGTPRLGAIFYDATVAAQIIATLTFMATSSGNNLPLCSFVCHFLVGDFHCKRFGLCVQ